MTGLVGRILVIFLALTTACMHTPVQNAETLGKGNFQVGIEPGVWGAGGEAAGVVFLPTFNVSGRYGISDRVDFGGRLGTSAYELSLKVMVTRPDAGGPIVSIAPRTTVLAVGTGDEGLAAYVNLEVPVLIGFGRKNQLVLGPFGRTIIAYDSSGGGTGIIAGTSVGYSLKLGSAFRMMPEVGVGVPLYTSITGIEDLEDMSGGALFSFQLGFLVGGPR